MSTCAHARAPAPDAAQISVALDAAERRCVSAGERWTSPRRRIYQLLLEAGAPVKAYDLIASYGGQSEPLAKPPTIYRALEFLIALGLVHRIESLNAFLACHSEHQANEAAFLICNCCGRADELHLGIARVASEAARHRGFRATRILLEVRCVCPGCR